MEDVRFYSFDSFFLLMIVFDIFNITFQFCFLKFKFWGGFASKYHSDCHVHHMRMAQTVFIWTLSKKLNVSMEINWLASVQSQIDLFKTQGTRLGAIFAPNKGLE